MSNLIVRKEVVVLAEYIVNTGSQKEVHRTAFTKSECNILAINPNNHLDTDDDYTVFYPLTYNGCKYCYPEKHRK